MRLPKQIGDGAIEDRIQSFRAFGVYLAAGGIANAHNEDYFAKTALDAKAGKDFVVFSITNRGGQVCLGRYVRQKAPKKSWVFKPEKFLDFALPIPVRRFK